MKKLNNIFKGFVKKTLSENKLDALNELNLLLISNDVATETADSLCEIIKKSLETLAGEDGLYDVLALMFVMMVLVSLSKRFAATSLKNGIFPAVSLARDSPIWR